MNIYKIINIEGKLNDFNVEIREKMSKAPKDYLYATKKITEVSELLKDRKLLNDPDQIYNIDKILDNAKQEFTTLVKLESELKDFKSKIEFFKSPSHRNAYLKALEDIAEVEGLLKQENVDLENANDSLNRAIRVFDSAVKK